MISLLRHMKWVKTYKWCHMKRTITLICAYLLLMIPVACGNNGVSATNEGATSMPQTESKTDESNNIVSEESNLHAYVSDGRWLDGI